MYARIETGPIPERDPRSASSCRPAARYLLSGSAGGCAVTLFRTAFDAAGELPAHGTGRDLLYEVIAHGERAGEVPSSAAVMWFDGPIDDERLGLLARACSDRILPALHSTPGLVRCIIGWNAATRAAVEVLLATSAEAIDVAGMALNAPWNGFVRGPDTLEPYVVTQAIAPSASL